MTFAVTGELVEVVRWLPNVLMLLTSLAFLTKRKDQNPAEPVERTL